MDIENMRKLAEKATPGPWIRSGVRQKLKDTDCLMVGPDGFLIFAVPVGHPKDHAGAFCDAGYLAACDPQTILALIDENDRLRNAVTASKPIIERLIAGEYNTETWGLKQRLAAIEAALAARLAQHEDAK